VQIFSNSQLERVRRALKKVSAKTTTAIAECMAEAGEHAVDHVKRYPKFRPRTGNLQDATQWRTIRTATGRVLRISNTAKYAGAIDQGARPHIIRPRRRKFLVFRVRGKLVFARKVNHPGNRPYKFLYKATNSAGRVLSQLLEQRMKRIADQF